MLDFFRITPKKRKIKIKKSKGIIYSNPSGVKRYIFYFGDIVVILAVIGFVYLYWPLGRAMYTYKFHSKTKETELTTFNSQTQPQEPVISEFNIQIPKIVAASKVITDISPFNSKEYLPVLSDDVIAQARGSGLPGDGNGKSIYLFAHSTRQGINMVRKNSVFYLLGELQNGDYIFVKYNGKVFKYRTYMKRIIKADETQYISYKEENREVLILQTCWPIGTDWKRLLVFAEKV
jgi:LPXTG-site transpeptidase (sortase) family protein